MQLECPLHGNAFDILVKQKSELYATKVIIVARPPDQSVIEIIFLISQPNHMLWVLKRSLSEMALLSTQNTYLNWWINWAA